MPIPKNTELMLEYLGQFPLDLEFTPNRIKILRWLGEHGSNAGLVDARWAHCQARNIIQFRRECEQQKIEDQTTPTPQEPVQSGTRADRKRP